MPFHVSGQRRNEKDGRKAEKQKTKQNKTSIELESVQMHLHVTIQTSGSAHCTLYMHIQCRCFKRQLLEWYTGDEGENAVENNVVTLSTATTIEKEM